MFILNFLVVILALYLFIYSIYLLTLNIKSFGAKKYFTAIDNKANVDKINKFCVIIWTQKKDKNPSEILQSFEEQTYPKNSFEVHMVNIYDNLEYGKMPPVSQNILIHKIENPDF